jgi:hypothetical protein
MGIGLDSEASGGELAPPPPPPPHHILLGPSDNASESRKKNFFAEGFEKIYFIICSTRCRTRDLIRCLKMQRERENLIINAIIEQKITISL